MRQIFGHNFGSINLFRNEKIEKLKKKNFFQFLKKKNYFRFLKFFGLFSVYKSNQIVETSIFFKKIDLLNCPNKKKKMKIFFSKKLKKKNFFLYF